MAIIEDLFSSNVNSVRAELMNKIAALQSVAVSAEDGGDFHETVKAQIAVVKAALRAAEDKAVMVLEEPKPLEELLATTEGPTRGPTRTQHLK